MPNIHASSVCIKNKGILLLGDSGAGKSDLSLRLIMRHQAVLVADDRVDITADNGIITASAPKILQGLLEVRGIGLVKTDYLPKAEICAVFELVSGQIERMPEAQYYEIGTQKLPLFKINPFEVSAPEKVLAALSLL